MSETEEKSKSKKKYDVRGLLRRFAGITMFGLATTTGGQAKTLLDNVDDKEEAKTEYTYAQDGASKKGKTYNVEVSRSFEEDDYNKDLTVETVVNEESSKGRTTHEKTEKKKERYSLGGGNTVATDVSETAVKRRQTGSVKASVTERTSSLHDESGAVSRAMGKEYVAESGNHSVSKNKFDKQGRYKASELHTTIASSGVSFRRDEVAKYDYTGNEVGVGDSDKYEVNNSISVNAKLYDRPASSIVQLSSGQGQKMFSAAIVNDVNETYNEIDGEKYKRITVRGDEVKIESSGDKKYSKAEIKRELKKARSYTNILLKKVTRGEIKDVSEYLSAMPMYNLEGSKPLLGEYFDARIDERRIAEESDKFREKHNESICEAKAITAQDVVNLKMEEFCCK